MPTVLITELEFLNLYKNKWKVITVADTPDKASELKQIKSEFDSQIIIFKMDIFNQRH